MIAQIPSRAEMGKPGCVARCDVELNDLLIMLETTVTRVFRQLIYLSGCDWQVASPLVCRCAMWVRNPRACCKEGPRYQIEQASPNMCHESRISMT